MLPLADDGYDFGSLFTRTAGRAGAGFFCVAQAQARKQKTSFWQKNEASIRKQALTMKQRQPTWPTTSH